MRATFYDFEITMTLDKARSISHLGDGAAEVKALQAMPKIRHQLKKISDNALHEELREYGTWDLEELLDRDANERRIVWLAANQIVNAA